MKPRSLKIQSRVNQKYHGYSVIPELTLKGNWFREAGFEYGMKVKVTKENNRLIIEPE